ncbi:MAG: hypothetical protein V1808_00685 [Candidatus Daviesbacteria bacterium]
MTEGKLNPVEQAFQEMPEAWWEQLNPKIYYLGSLLTCLSLYFIYKNSINIENFESHLISAILYTIGTVADRISTGKFLDAGQKLQEVNTGEDTYILQELNPLAGNPHSSSELNRNPRTWVLDGIGLIAASILTPVGPSVLLARGFASMNNLRLARRANRMTELFLSNPESTNS